MAGNDMLSSCLYVGGICIKVSGKMAPFSIVLVIAMLYLFRFIYAEVIIPPKGGVKLLLSFTLKTLTLHFFTVILYSLRRHAATHANNSTII